MPWIKVITPHENMTILGNKPITHGLNPSNILFAGSPLITNGMNRIEFRNRYHRRQATSPLHKIHGSLFMPLGGENLIIHILNQDF